jgi:hypothetical protein
MPEPRHHALIIGRETEIGRVAPMLRRSEFSVHSAEPTPFILDLVLSTPFELVIAAYPMDIVPLDDLLDTIRDRGSACHGAGLVLLAEPEYLDDAQNQVGLGANRAICTEWSEARLMRSVNDLLDVAPRIDMRVPLHTDFANTKSHHRLIFQTINVSITGALLQGWDATKPSDNFSFLFRLPGGGLVEGSAEVVRHTNRMREGVEGFGARFGSFGGLSEKRLLDHIQRQVDSVTNSL